MNVTRCLLLLVLLPTLLGCPGPVPVPDADPPGEWGQVPVSIQGRLAADEPAPELTEAVVVGEEQVIHLFPELRLWSEHVRHADASYQPELFTLRLWFTEDGAARVERVTEEYIGLRFALLVNGRPVSAPMIAQPIAADPELPVTVQFRLAEPEAAELLDAVSRTWPEEEAP